MSRVSRLFLFSLLAVNSVSLFAPEKMHEGKTTREEETKKQEEQKKAKEEERKKEDLRIEEEKLREEQEEREKEERERDKEQYEQEEKNKIEESAPQKEVVDQPDTDKGSIEQKVEETEVARKKRELQLTEETMRKLAQQNDMSELVNLFVEGKDPVAQSLQKVVNITEVMMQQDMVQNFNEAAVLEDVLTDQIASEAPGFNKRIFLEKQLVDVQATQEVWMGRIAKRVQIEVAKTAENIRKILLKEVPKPVRQRIVEPPTTFWGAVKYNLRSAIDVVAQGVKEASGNIKGKVKEGIDYLFEKVVTKEEVRKRQEKVTLEYRKLSNRLKNIQENVSEGTTEAQQRLNTLLETVSSLANEGVYATHDVTQMTELELKEDKLLTKSRSKIEQIQSELLHAMGSSTAKMESYAKQLDVQGGGTDPIDTILDKVITKLKVTKNIIDVERQKHIDMSKLDAKIVQKLTNTRLVEVDRLLTNGTFDGVEKAKSLLNDSLLKISSMIEQVEQTITTLYSKSDRFLSPKEREVRDNNASRLNKELTKLRRRQTDLEIRVTSLEATGKAQELGRQELVRKGGVKALWNRVTSKINELLFKWGIKDYVVKGSSSVDAQVRIVVKAVNEFTGDVSNPNVDPPRVKEWKETLSKYSKTYDEIYEKHEAVKTGKGSLLKPLELGELRTQLNEVKEKLIAMEKEASTISALAEDVQVIGIATELQERLVSEAPIIATADGKIDSVKMKDLLNIDKETGRADNIQEEDFAQIGFGMVGHDRVYIQRLGDQLLEEELAESGKVDEVGTSLIAYRQKQAGSKGDIFIRNLQEKWKQQQTDKKVDFDAFELGVLRDLLRRGSNAITSWKTKSFDQWTNSEFSQLATYREGQYLDEFNSSGGANQEIGIRKKAARDIGTYGDCASHIIRILKGQETSVPKASAKSLKEITAKAGVTGAVMNGELSSQIMEYSDADSWLKTLEDLGTQKGIGSGG